MEKCCDITDEFVICVSEEDREQLKKETTHEDLVDVALAGLAVKHGVGNFVEIFGSLIIHAYTKKLNYFGKLMIVVEKIEPLKD